MYLEKIQLAGFKSFAKKTTLDFAEGMTAIVGPNGSGKSNIADAIRWVLGEQSMKTLRGKKSDDVIFAGTKQKGRMGVAEVTLVFNNEEKKIPLEYKKVEITRRVYRDGEGEYMINKSKVRLLDIHELLAKAGFGQGTYGVIGQGMIDSLLKATPKDLREMFYDACGVRKYHLKKSISETKLSRTRTNLERGAELIEEIGPRLKGLEREASRAERKAKLDTELAETRDTYFSHVYLHAIQKEEAISEELKSEITKDKKLGQQIDELEKRLEKATDDSLLEKRQKIARELQEYQNKLNALQQQKLIFEGKIEIENERDSAGHISELKRQIEENEKDAYKLSVTLKVIEAQLERAQKKKSFFEKSVSDAAEKVKSASNSIAAKRNEIKNSNVTIEDVDAAMKAFIENEESAIEGILESDDIQEVKDYVKHSHKKIKTLSKQIDGAHINGKLEKELQDLIAIKGAADAKLLAVSQKFNELKSVISADEREIASLKSQKNNIDAKLSSLRKRIEDEQKNQKNASVIAGLEKSVKKTSHEIALVNQQITKKQEELEGAEKEEKQQRVSIRDTERSFRALNNNRSEQRDVIRVLESREAQARMKTTAVYQEMLEEVGQEGLEEYLEKIEKVESSATDKEIEAITRKRKDAQRALLSLQDVDVSVLEEYNETKKRFEFLTEQRTDLFEAEKKLKKLISELDVKIEETFNASFDKIATLFQKYFTVLFNGGKAQLTKKYSHDLTEAEALYDEEAKKKRELLIEVHVNPPGKKLSNLSMLSGGERAMASIALLMAIIESNPPPFIVLDEVDAALDEANSRRFAKIISAAVKRSQVLAITHNRATMSESSILYGVTMQESGISNVLSVKLSEAQKIKKKAPKKRVRQMV